MTRFVVIGVLSAVLLAGTAPVMALDGGHSFRGAVEAWFAKVWDGMGSFFEGSEVRAKDESPEMVLPRDDEDSDGPIGDVIIPRK